MMSTSTAGMWTALAFVWGFVSALLFADRLSARELLRAYLDWLDRLFDRLIDALRTVSHRRYHAASLRVALDDAHERLRQHRAVIDRYTRRYGYLPPDLDVVDPDEGGPDAA